MATYPFEIDNPYSFPWRVGDRIERTDNETGAVVHDTIVRIPEYRYEPHGPLAVGAKNRPIVFWPTYSMASIHSYRLLSRKQIEQIEPAYNLEERTLIRMFRNLTLEQKEVVRKMTFFLAD